MKNSKKDNFSNDSENIKEEINESVENNSDNLENQENLKLKDQFARLTADFENYKKRVIKERSSWEQSAKSVVIEDLLSIINDLDIAYDQLQKAPEEVRNWLVGIEIIYKNFQKFLSQQGVVEVPVSEFNPEIHEALNQVAATEDTPSGSIVTVYEKGYTLNGNLIRPAKVSVAE